MQRLRYADVLSNGATPNDDQCEPGQYCDLRIANRMFCDNAVIFYAKDYCADGGVEGGSEGGVDGGVDAGDAASDAEDAGP